jgi:hypothetical protein
MSTKATDDGICDFDRLRHAKPVGAQAYWRGGGCPLRRCYQPRIPGPFNISSSDGTGMETRLRTEPSRFRAIISLASGSTRSHLLQLPDFVHLAQPPGSLPAGNSTPHGDSRMAFTSWFISSCLTVQHGSTPQPSTSAGCRSPGLATMVRKGGKRPGVSSQLACDKGTAKWQKHITKERGGLGTPGQLSGSGGKLR